MAAQPQPANYDTAAKLKEMDTVPLFMKSLPDDPNEHSEALEALQALVHDGTPDEIASNFKEQGNDCFKQKRYRDALGFYNQAMEAKPTDTVLKESLLLNRAACNLELKNYGSVLRDTSKVLSTNATNLKAFYRAALALIALEKTVEAIDCCKRALQIDSENSGIKSALEKAEKLKALQDKKEDDKRRAKEEAALKQRKLDEALKSRNVLVVPSAPGAPSLDLRPVLSDEQPPTLSVPIIFLYPQYSQSDIISAFHEDTMFTQHLEVMFPPAGARPGWDVMGQYTLDNLVVYAQTRAKRLLKIGKKMTLADLFQHAAAKPGEKVDGLEMVDGHLSVVVLPKGSVEKEWIEEFKRQRGF